MSLMRRLQDDFEWPEWLSNRWMFEPADTLFRGLGAGQMHIEEFQEDGSMIVRAELPGIDPERDLEITESDRTLWIRAERRREKKSEDARTFHSEFHYGSLVRGIPLPRRANTDKVVASYADGVLEVRIPLDGSTETGRRIPVQHH